MIDKTFRCTRFVFNKFLSERKKYEESKIKLSTYEQIKELPGLKKENKWLKEVDSCALQKKNIFRGNGYSKYRAKGERESYTTNEYKNAKYESIRIDFKSKV